MEETLKKIAKGLASCEKKVRDKTVKYVTGFLRKGGESLTDDDLSKIWRGLYFCMWHSDKPLIQEELATRLGNLGPESLGVRSFRFGEAFFREMRVQWGTIDDLRLEKFMRLVRRVLEGLVGVVVASNWDPAAISGFCDSVLRHGALDTQAVPPVPSDLALHVLSILLPTVEKIAVEESKKRKKPEGDDGEEETGSESGVIPRTMTDAVLDACTDYAESGTNISLVEAIHSNVIRPLIPSQSHSEFERDIDAFKARVISRGEKEGLEQWQRSRMHRIVDHIIASRESRERPVKPAQTVNDIVKKITTRLERIRSRKLLKKRARRGPLTKKQRTRKMHIEKQREIRKKSMLRKLAKTTSQKQVTEDD